MGTIVGGGVTMATITVKNIPTDLYERLKQSAEANRRSINSEVIVCIERAVRSRKIHPEATLARARELREKTGDYLITDDEFTQAKIAGRL
jgi:plasmid stability protein